MEFGNFAHQKAGASRNPKLALTTVLVTGLVVSSMLPLDKLLTVASSETRLVRRFVLVKTLFMANLVVWIPKACLQRRA